MQAEEPSHPFYRLARSVRAYLEGHGRLVATLEDPTYGRLEVYELARESR